ncbi:hypothetical protein evm_014206 [Chilo suppressalis]|nr:hypothetical protein evm_014206 [Chilo suppressalis]
MSKRVEQAEREKDAAVMRYASVECMAIEAKRAAEKAANAEKAALTEVELLNSKLKSAHGEKHRICQLYDDKCHELANSEREVFKVREEIKELEGRLKWTQSKLRMEMDAYKESAERAEKLSQQVSELEAARDSAAAHAGDSAKVKQLESDLKECQAALILCRTRSKTWTNSCRLSPTSLTPARGRGTAILPLYSPPLPSLKVGAVHTPTPSTLFEVEFCNIRGLHSNLNAVHHHLETARPALLFLTETQILPPADTGYLNYPGYVLEESFKAKAGVCLYVRADVCCRRLRCLEDPSFSMLGVHVDSGPLARVYVCLYRSHTGDVETTRLFEHLSRAADDAQEQFPNAELVFLGDFNAHHNLWLSSSKTDHAGISAHAFALTHDLKQLVDQPTRIPDIPSQAPSLLDLLLTTHPQGYQVVVRAPLGSSDHCLISAKAPQAKPPRPAVVKRRIWHYGSADWDGMRDYFTSVPWKQRCFSDRDLSASAVAITEEIIMGMEYYIPHSDLISKGTRNLWFNHDCAEAASRKQSRTLSAASFCDMTSQKETTACQDLSLPSISSHYACGERFPPTIAIRARRLQRPRLDTPSRVCWPCPPPAPHSLA